MDIFRRNRTLMVFVAAITMATYTVVGMSAHICYTSNERTFGISFLKASCQHEVGEACCQIDQHESCGPESKCYAPLAPPEDGLTTLKAVCCVDKTIRLAPDEGLVQHKQLQINVLQFVSWKHNAIELFSNADVQTKDASPPGGPPLVGVVQKFLFYHQLRLDPDLA
ncbi:MAG: hypothetical protein IPM52_08760 [Bacteroidetes bacterium]|nr:hypothetical protein [Bacteroidota bacterium]